MFASLTQTQKFSGGLASFIFAIWVSFSHRVKFPRVAKMAKINDDGYFLCIIIIYFFKTKPLHHPAILYKVTGRQSIY